MSYGWNPLSPTLLYQTDYLIEQTPYDAACPPQTLLHSDIDFQLINEQLPGIRLLFARSETVQRLQQGKSPVCDVRAKVSIRLQVGYL